MIGRQLSGSNARHQQRGTSHDGGGAEEISTRQTILGHIGSPFNHFGDANGFGQDRLIDASSLNLSKRPPYVAYLA